MKLPVEIFYEKTFEFFKKENMRNFKTGATRDTEEGKLDYEGFFNPLVIERFAQYMHKNRTQADGKLRDSDNWQKGIPTKAYMKSLMRHFMDLWKEHRGYRSRDGIEEALCGIMFNSMGYLFEILNDERKRISEQLTEGQIRAFNKMLKGGK